MFGLHTAIVIGIYIAMTVMYGGMAGFTINLARRYGMTDGPDIACGLCWPLGLGIVLAYGSSHELGQDPEQRHSTQLKRNASNRAEELAEQRHYTIMAELKQKETNALEVVTQRIAKAKELGVDPGLKSLEPGNTVQGGITKENRDA